MLYYQPTGEPAENLRPLRDTPKEQATLRARCLQINHTTFIQLHTAAWQFHTNPKV